MNTESAWSMLAYQLAPYSGCVNCLLDSGFAMAGDSYSVVARTRTRTARPAYAQTTCRFPPQFCWSANINKSSHSSACTLINICCVLLTDRTFGPHTHIHHPHARIHTTYTTFVIYYFGFVGFSVEATHPTYFSLRPPPRLLLAASLLHLARYIRMQFAYISGSKIVSTNIVRPHSLPRNGLNNKILIYRSRMIYGRIIIPVIYPNVYRNYSYCFVCFVPLSRSASRHSSHSSLSPPLPPSFGEYFSNWEEWAWKAIAFISICSSYVHQFVYILFVVIYSMTI